MNRDFPETMPKAEFIQIRKQLNLTRDAFALELGFRGTGSTNKVTIKRFEIGERPVPMHVAKLAWMLSNYGLPDWPSYLEASPAEPQEIASAEVDK